MSKAISILLTFLLESMLCSEVKSSWSDQAVVIRGPLAILTGPGAFASIMLMSECRWTTDELEITTSLSSAFSVLAHSLSSAVSRVVAGEICSFDNSSAEVVIRAATLTVALSGLLALSQALALEGVLACALWLHYRVALADVALSLGRAATVAHTLALFVAVSVTSALFIRGAFALAERIPLFDHVAGVQWVTHAVAFAPTYPVASSLASALGGEHASVGTPVVLVLSDQAEIEWMMLCSLVAGRR